MAHPLREHVEWYVRADGVDAVAVAQSLGSTVRTVGNSGIRHHGLDVPSRGIACPGPEQTVGLSAAFLSLPDAMDHVEGVEEGRRHRHGPVDAEAALLQALEHHRPAGQIHARRRECQGFADPAAGVVQNRAECPYRPIGRGRRCDEGAAFVGGQIEAPALGVMACGTDCISSVPKAIKGGLARSAKCLICRAADPALEPWCRTEVP